MPCQETYVKEVFQFENKSLPYSLDTLKEPIGKEPNLQLTQNKPANHPLKVGGLSLLRVLPQQRYLIQTRLPTLLHAHTYSAMGKVK